MKAHFSGLLFSLVGAYAQDIPGGQPTREVPPSTSAAASARAPKAAAAELPSKWDIHWEFHAITLPAKMARPILPELRDEATIAAGWAKLEALIDKDEAAVTLETRGQVVAGRESKYSQVEEVRWALEFEQPWVVEKDGAPDYKRKGQPGEALPIASTPTTFDTRKIGITVSLGAEVSADGKRLRVSSEVDHTWFLHWDEFEVGRLANNEKLVVHQPRFAAVSRKDTSAMLAGERVLLSSHPVPGEKGKTELFLLRVWTKPQPAVDAK